MPPRSHFCLCLLLGYFPLPLWDPFISLRIQSMQKDLPNPSPSPKSGVRGFTSTTSTIGECLRQSDTSQTCLLVTGMFLHGLLLTGPTGALWFGLRKLPSMCHLGSRNVPLGPCLPSLLVITHLRGYSAKNTDFPSPIVFPNLLHRQ